MTHLVTVHGLPVQRACRAVGLGRATYYRRLVDWARRDAPVIAALMLVAAKYPRWGFWKCCGSAPARWASLESKRLWRVYCQLRLNLASPDEEAAPGSASPAARGDPAAQRGVGGGLHE